MLHRVRILAGNGAPTIGSDPRSTADLTREQIVTMHEGLRGPYFYLRQLRDRMLECGFPKVEILLIEAERSFDAVHSLSISLHYTKNEKTRPGSTAGPGGAHAGELRPITAPPREEAEVTVNVDDTCLGETASDPFVYSLQRATYGATHRHVLRRRFQTACRVLGRDRLRTLTIHHGRHTFISTHWPAGGLLPKSVPPRGTRIW